MDKTTKHTTVEMMRDETEYTQEKAKEEPFLKVAISPSRPLNSYAKSTVKLRH
jgi:hypothetical protein